MLAPVGRARITSEQGEGLYSIELDFGSTEINAKIAAIQARIDELINQLVEAEAGLAQAQQDVRAFWESVSIAIQFFRNNPDSETALDTINERTAIALEQQNVVRAWEREVADRKLEKSQLETEKQTLESEAVVFTGQAWCADYTLEATGDVATIEINGETNQILIAPGAEEPDNADGEVRDVLSVSGATAYLNAAILPGWQKFSPTFRVGSLTAIDRASNRGTVSLDAAESSAQSLNINQSASVDGEFQYLSCNHLAFNVGDEVVVQFVNQDWEQPKIIGFASNPKPCGPERLWIPLDWISVGPFVSITTSVTPPTLQPGETYKAYSNTLATSVDGISEKLWYPTEWGPGNNIPPLAELPKPSPLWRNEEGTNQTVSGSIGSIMYYYGWAGALVSESGAGSDAVYKANYSVSASSVSLVYIGPSSALLSFGGLGFSIVDSLQMFATDVLDVVPNLGHSKRDYSFGFAQNDDYDEIELEDLDQLAFAAAKTEFMAERFGAPLPEVTLTDDNGSAIVYEFQRFGTMSVGPASNGIPDSHPGIAQRVGNAEFGRGGPALIYRRKR